MTKFIHLSATSPYTHQAKNTDWDISRYVEIPNTRRSIQIEILDHIAESNSNLGRSRAISPHIKATLEFMILALQVDSGDCC